MILLGLLLVLGQSRVCDGPGRYNGRVGRNVGCINADPYAYFEFAPSSGAGMGTACACGTVTGAKGEAMTFTRASSAYCTKEGLATTGLTTTSMVQCSTNQIRVEADGSGVLGILVENARTNLALRSEEILTAPWVNAGTTRTADQATTPWGSATADRVETSGGALNAIYQAVVGTGSVGAWTFSVYFRANSGTPTFYCYAYEGAGSPSAFTAVVLNTSTWTRCVVTLTKVAVTGLSIGVGVDTSIGMSAQTADVLVAGMQAETGAYATSYIPTTTAAVTRAAETAVQFAGVSLAGMASTGSAAGTITPAAASESAGAPIVFFASTGRALYINTANQISLFDGTNLPVLSAGFAAGTAKRYWSSWTGSTAVLTNVTDVTTTSGSFDGTLATTGPLETGANATLGTRNLIISRVCLDPSSTRCR